MILSRLTLGILFSCISLALIAQNNSFNFVKLDNKESSDLNKKFKSYDQYSFDIASFKNYIDNQGEIESFTLAIPDVGVIEMELYAYDLISEDHFITTKTASGNIISKINDNITYKGYTSQGDVRFTINNDFLNGFIETRDGTYYLESASSLLIDDSYIVVYHENQVKKQDNGGCAFSDKQIANEKISSSSQKIVAECYEVNLGVAADFSMYEKHGDTESLINHLVSVMNNVAANYEYNSTTNFDDGVEFKLVEHFISACESCDPWTESTNVFTLFYNFKAWTNLEIGFQNDIDLGQFWTDRNFDGSYVGLADFGTDLFCNGNVAHVLQDFTTSAAFLRVMTSHEIGHNFNGLHINNSGYIMSSTVNNTNVWNTQNKTRISTELVNQGPTCLNSCGGTVCSDIDDLAVSNITTSSFDLSWSNLSPNDYTIYVFDEDTQDQIYTINTSLNTHTLSPSVYTICENYRVEVYHNCASGASASTVIVFESPKAQGCADFCPDTNIQWSDNMIDFTDESENATTWFWDFGDGNTSTLQSPSHLYATAGFYDVTLSVNGGMHEMTYDSVVAILPDRNLPYTTGQGGSFDTPWDEFASMAINDTENIWERGIATGPLSSSSNVWKTDLDDDLENQDRASLLYTPRFNFSSTGTYILEFDLSMEIQYCNAPIALQLQYTTDMGANWTRLGSEGDTGSNIQNWYNRGPNSSCPLATQVFADQTGWTFNGSDVETSYDVSFLSGNDEVIFRFYFSAYAGYPSGYAVDGVMIDDFEIIVEGVVPVKLSSFDGETKSDYNQLNWEMEEAINFDYFQVEKSEDGVQFYNLEKVFGIDGVNKYTAQDHNPSTLNYYRLKMVDLDGSYDYSKIISLGSRREEGNMPQFFPNPLVQDQLYLRNITDIDKVEIINPNGKMVVSREPMMDYLDTSSLAAGIYIIQFIKDGKVIQSDKLIRI